MVKLLLGAGRACRRRTMPPTRWPSPSATCTRSRRGRRVAAAGLPARPSRRRAGATTGPHDRDRAPARPHSSTSNPTASSSTSTASATTSPCRCRPSTGWASAGAESRSASTRTCAKTRWRCTGSRRGLEQELFERLIGVSGIGPKVALAVLSGIEPPDLVRAIERGDVARLTAIPGVGKKTSERIVLELKDRLPRPRRRPRLPAARGARPSTLRDDVLSALMNLGYHRPLAEKAVESASVGRRRTATSSAR